MPNLSSPTLPGMPHKFWENIAEMAYLPDVSQNPVYGGFRVSRELPYLTPHPRERRLDFGSRARAENSAVGLCATATY